MPLSRRAFLAVLGAGSAASVALSGRGREPLLALPFHGGPKADRAFFAQAGFDVGPSETNFLMVDLRRDVKGFKCDCLKKGVAVGRPFPPLNTHVRISIGTKAEMEAAMEVFREVLK